MEQDQSKGEGGRSRSYIEKRYGFKGALAESKLKQYIPILILTNLSSLLLVTVDGIVAGNLISEEAFAAISIIAPVNSFIGALTLLFSSGTSSCLSLALGRADTCEIQKYKHSTMMAMIFASLACLIIQVPMTFAIVASYHLSPAMATMVRDYLIGALLATPFSVVSTIGVGQLQIIGKMKVLMVLAAIEGVTNLIFDLLFVGAFNMGIAGTGYGTLLANIIRATLTVVYLALKTDLFRFGGQKSGFRELKEVCTLGLPDTANQAILTVQSYIILKVILSVAGEKGTVVCGICSFTLNLMAVLMNAVMGSMRPLVGLFSGANFMKGLRLLIRQARLVITILALSLISLMVIVPGLFFDLNGVTTPPDGSYDALRIFSLALLLKGYNSIYRTYFTNRGEPKFTTILTVAGNCILPVFVFVISLFLPWQWIWLSYPLTETVMIFINQMKYSKKMNADIKTEKNDVGLLFLSVEPDQAIEASRTVRRYAEEVGANMKVAYLSSLCLEEMVAYVVSSQKNENVKIEILIHFTKDGGKFIMLDDGKCISLNEDEDLRTLTTDNYTLLKRITKSMKYQYILNLNYTEYTF